VSEVIGIYLGDVQVLPREGFTSRVSPSGSRRIAPNPLVSKGAYTVGFIR
jgi:hypothetical protein